MERRDVLKSISPALGYTLTPATLAGLLTSCRTEEKSGWEPLYLSSDGAIIVEELGEALLPQTETPGSKAVKSHVFVDVFLSKVALPADRVIFDAGMMRWQSAFEEHTGKSVTQATAEDFTAGLRTYFSVPEQRQSEIRQLINSPKPQGAEKAVEYLTYKFLFTLKRLIMLGFYASGEIGENVLSYLPVPGRYEACIPAEQVGNAWSL